MKKYRLDGFICENMESILQAWEDFARTIEPPALTMDDAELRDHARQMLHTFAQDLGTPQSDAQRSAKSRGLGGRGSGDTAAETHAEARLMSGYTVVQLVSEYRALRSSVLTLWAASGGHEQASDLQDVMRFNEAVDQAVAESVARHDRIVKQSQNMFLAILGHDLRNPLGTVFTGSTVLMQANDVPSRYVLVATRMFNSAKRMRRLIDDLIDFTRTRLGPGIPVRVKQGNIAEVCAQVIDELRTAHPERGIAYEAPHQLDAIFDDSRIAQLLSNLAGNALQYGDPGMSVMVRLDGRGDQVELRVHNHGAPIPSAELPGIFDPMVRIGARSGCDRMERGSMGIGLFISRQIAHAHGGVLDVASSVADGTTFTLTMPRLPAGFGPMPPGADR